MNIFGKKKSVSAEQPAAAAAPAKEAAKPAAKPVTPGAAAPAASKPAPAGNATAAKPASAAAAPSKPASAAASAKPVSVAPSSKPASAASSRPASSAAPAKPASTKTAAKAAPAAATTGPKSHLNVPPMLMWSVLRQHSSFTIKTAHRQFTREPGNLLNVNSFKYSGLAHAQTIDVRPAPTGKGVQMTVTRKAAVNKPAKRQATTTFPVVGVRRVAKTVRGLAKNGYRADLQHAALARVSAIKRSQQKPSAPVKTGRRNLKKAAKVKKTLPAGMAPTKKPAVAAAKKA